VKNLGYSQGSSTFVFDTTIAGNSNTGRDYENAKFRDEERDQRIEFLKTR